LCLPDTLKLGSGEFTDTLTQENELLGDIAASSIVPEGNPRSRKA
jgi:hypothetical protein